MENNKHTLTTIYRLKGLITTVVNEVKYLINRNKAPQEGEQRTGAFLANFYL